MRIVLLLFLGLLLAACSRTSTVLPDEELRITASSTVVISQFRVRGPNGAADEFIELYNLSSEAVDISGWKVQGSNSSAAVSIRATIPIETTLNPGCYYLLTNRSTSGGPYSGAVPGDLTFATGITDDGGIAVTLANTTIVDQVGMSSGSAFKEGEPLPALSGTSNNIDQSYQRKPGGSLGNGTDTDDNSNDFDLISPSTPRNSSPEFCVASNSPTNPSGTGAADPEAVSPGDEALLIVTVTPGANPESTGITVTGDLSAIGGSSSQAFSDDGTNGDETAGDGVFSFSAMVAEGTEPGEKTLTVSIEDAQDRSGTSSITLQVLAPPVAIYDIHGAGHISPFAGDFVTTTGVVTVVAPNGFYLQDPDGDDDDETSDGIFVFTSSRPVVSVTDSLRVSGTVAEFTPGGGSSGNLSITQIVGPTVTVLEDSLGMVTPTVIGAGGRTPPTELIAANNHFENGIYDPEVYGIDFYESLEGMLVTVQGAVAVSPTNRFNEIWVLADGGTGATGVNARGGITIAEGDFNPERIQIQLNAAYVPRSFVDAAKVDVADELGDVTGVMSYAFGNYEVLATETFSVTSGDLKPEVTTLTAGTEKLTVASYNVENLHPGSGQQIADIADHIVMNLSAPDIVSLQEIQDNSGPTNDGTVDASQTYGALIAAIALAGGPEYEFRDIAPVDGQDGGQPGGNIRVGYLFNPERVSFVDRGDAGPTDANSVVATASRPVLELSPGRIEPSDSAFTASRKPLAGEFLFNGHRVFIVNNHFSSKGGSSPLFGTVQPPLNSREDERKRQAQIVNDFVAEILAEDPRANVIVMGDLNEFYFFEPLLVFEGTLDNLIEAFLVNERYSYVFEGNSQALDHTLVSPNLTEAGAEYDIVHVNAEFFAQVSDHDPAVSRYTLTIRLALELLKGDVQALSAAGLLNGGQGHALIARIDAAIRSLDRGQAKTASNQLQAFVNQLNDFVASGQLPEAEARPLLEVAQSIIDALN
jgi:predicted extracellular nuclease